MRKLLSICVFSLYLRTDRVSLPLSSPSCYYTAVKSPLYYRESNDNEVVWGLLAVAAASYG